MIRRFLIASLVICALSMWLAARDAVAQVVKPFKISGSGVATEGLPFPTQPPRLHTIVGEATHLGRHTGSGSVQIDTAEFDPDAGTISGEFGGGTEYTFIGANGDELVCWYGRTDHGASQPGHYELTIVDFTAAGPVVEAVFVAEFVVQGDLSTGKFAGASGSWIMIAVTDPFVLGSSDPADYSWEGEGSITFKKK